MYKKQAGFQISKGMLFLTLASVALFVFYVIWVAARPQQVFWSLDEGGKYIYLQSILQTGRIDTPLIYPAAKIDPDLQFVPLFYSIRRDNQLYSWWGVGLPLVSLPFFQLFGWVGLYLLPAAAGAVSAFLSGAIVRRLTESWRLAVLACLITGLASPVTFYSTMFWEHTLSAVFCLAALFVLLYAYDRRNIWPGLLAGGFASLSIFFRLDTAPLLVGFGLIMLVKRWKQSLLFAAGTLLTSIPWLRLNYWTSGHPLGPIFTKIIDRPAFGTTLGQVGLKFIPYALFNAPRADTFTISNRILFLLSFLLLVGSITAFIRSFRWVSILSFAGLAAVCAWVLFQPSQYQAVNGIILVAPQIVFGLFLFAVPGVWKKTPYPVMLFTAVALYSIAYIILGWVTAGGLQWGPRYLLTIYPLLLIAAITGLSSLFHVGEIRTVRWAAAVFTFACLVAAGFQVRGIVTARTLMGYYQRSIPVFADLGDAPVVLAWEGFSMDVPSLYWQGNVLSLSSDFPDWDLWNLHARELGLSYYYKARLLTVDNAPLDVIEQRLEEYPSGVIITRVPVTQ